MSLHNTHIIHVLNYTNYKNCGYQTPENILKPIFKVVTKYQKMR